MSTNLIKEDMFTQLLRRNQMSVKERIFGFDVFYENIEKNLYQRKVLSPMDREVLVKTSFEEKAKKMLMFGSNNYLGFANNEKIKKEVLEAININGVGLSGPPLLNGYHHLICELENKIAAFEEQQSALLFSSGYAANLGIFSTISTKKDIVLIDEQHHASCFDGLTLGNKPYKTFPHNDMAALENLFNDPKVKAAQDVFIAVEGVYSMSGDIAPLDKLVKICETHNAYLILDDAHGSGVMGKNGRGTASHFQVQDKIFLSMGTFSKTFASTGGFVAGRKEIIAYLRYFARSYMFSAGLLVVNAQTVLTGLNLLERDPSIHQRLKDNTFYMARELKKLGFDCNDETPIFIIPAKEGMDFQEAIYEFHKMGVFLNAVEYPAVPKGKKYFRLSISAIHTREDLDFLLSCINTIIVGAK